MAAVAATAVLVGCGSGGASSSPSQGGGSTSKDSTSTSAAKPPKPIEPPPQKETFADAEKRIDAAFASGDCNKINALALVTQKNPDPKKLQKSCAKLKKRLAGQKPTGGQSFKGLAGVLDYATKRRNLSVVLLRAGDGLYHIAFVDKFESGPTAGTPLAPKYSDVAKAAFAALKTKNCDAYFNVAYAATGSASRGKQKACARISKNIVAKTLEKVPSATPKLIGGNRFFAFYGLDGKKYLTLVLAREAASQRPSNAKQGKLVVPKGAPEYGYVDAYPTNERQPKSK
jgi:hypothetical protein